MPEARSPHFEVRRLTPDIILNHNACKVRFRWGVYCLRTGGRWKITRTREEATRCVEWYDRKNCWFCDEADRKDGVVKEVNEGHG